MTAVTALPTIMRFIDRTDSGEFGNDTCAHCGALGRYQHRFMCDDGRVHAAMSGCVKLYPVSPIADEHRKITERRAEREADGRQLASWDAAKLAAIDAYYAETTPTNEQHALDVIRRENQRRSEWTRKRFGGRR